MKTRKMKQKGLRAEYWPLAKYASKNKCLGTFYFVNLLSENHHHWPKTIAKVSLKNIIAKEKQATSETKTLWETCPNICPFPW